MKTIIATIKPFKVDDVKDALRDLDCTGFRHTECKGYGKQKGHTELYRGAPYIVDFLPKVDIFITVNDDQVHSVCKQFSNQPRPADTVMAGSPSCPRSSSGIFEPARMRLRMSPW